MWQQSSNFWQLIRSSGEMPLTVLRLPCRTSVLSAEVPSCQRPQRGALPNWIELLVLSKEGTESGKMAIL
jgi:hypothetical protein